MTQTDKRITRTKKLLRDALIVLCLEKAYENITIQDITDRADIGYRTFFRHYSDKDELLQEVLAATLMEVRELMAIPPPEIFADPTTDVTQLADFSILFRHVQSHSELYRVFLSSQRTIVESVTEFAIADIKATFGTLTLPNIPIDLIACHIISATFGMIRWWLNNDMKQLPEEMAEHHMRLILHPTRQTILASLEQE